MPPFRSSRCATGTWHHEWTSLSTGPLVAKMDSPPNWNPSRGGVEFKPVPGAAKPAADR